MRLRTQRPVAATPHLWLGTRSRSMGYEGLHNTLRRRAKRVVIDGFHPHRLRHTATHRWLAKGGSEAGLTALAGWPRTDMLVRYTRARASEESWRLNLEHYEKTGARAAAYREVTETRSRVSQRKLKPRRCGRSQ